ncbi:MULTISPECIES: branched-chain amino acid ABC transporter permease [Bradyrhizobium]|uniref:Branched-chain amino acid ABC transporter permease n=1 Tax=Bradyrhizobium brasilense TaxID=1419277 RepID=A0ABY8JLS4_9BRAD|nr:branched-chain amino acid ABC transporter permease [Bradyrhizobium brasilense]WFU65341.1 branched-chain amino acid ABC transporter permease [Bradyrhizobium brasilense]
MTADVAAILLQDGIANGAIYILLATALVLVFTVTRVIFVPQGDLVAFTALTLSAFDTGVMPGTVWILLFGAAIAFALEMLDASARRDRARVARSIVQFGIVPLAVALVAAVLVPKDAPLLWKMAVTCALITCISPVIYRIVFQPIASASPLVLLIAAIATHLGLNSIGLHVFGAEGVRTQGFSGPPFSVAGQIVSQQVVGVIGSSVVLVLVLYVFFHRSLRGRALLAAAYNRRGAEIVGISAVSAGRTAFIVAGFVGAASGLLVGPMTTLYYDSGFILGLKGFVGAIVGGLAIYPLAAAGALLVGTVEAFASFWASAYRDIIVFMLIIPILFWRSVVNPHVEDGIE